MPYTRQASVVLNSIDGCRIRIEIVSLTRQYRLVSDTMVPMEFKVTVQALGRQNCVSYNTIGGCEKPEDT